MICSTNSRCSRVSSRRRARDARPAARGSTSSAGCGPVMMLSSTLMPLKSARLWNVRAMPLAAASCGSICGAGLAEEHDASPSAAVDAVDHVQHRALAGAVRADDRADLVLADVEGNVLSAFTPPNDSEMSRGRGSRRRSCARSRGAGACRRRVASFVHAPDSLAVMPPPSWMRFRLRRPWRIGFRRETETRRSSLAGPLDRSAHVAACPGRASDRRRTCASTAGGNSAVDRRSHRSARLIASGSSCRRLHFPRRERSRASRCAASPLTLPVRPSSNFTCVSMNCTVLPAYSASTSTSYFSRDEAAAHLAGPRELVVVGVELLVQDHEAMDLRVGDSRIAREVRVDLLDALADEVVDLRLGGEVGVARVRQPAALGPVAHRLARRC
jgi:hypothetical protein